MKHTIISIEGLWKKFHLGKAHSSSLRESITRLKKRQQQDYFWALSDINVQISEGEAVGIIGKNGAGKSTLLKILSRITYPTKGSIVMEGRVSSLLEVGTGFHPELTGRQNVFLNGTILGMKRNEIKQKFDEIVAFSGIEKFIDTPIKHFSSGMKVRLAFSVAAHLEPEILIIDEVLAVGDADFQRKCLGKMEDVTGQGRTVLFVSHNMDAVSTLCNRIIHLQNGIVANDTTHVSRGIQQYLNNSFSGQSSEWCWLQINQKNEYYSIADFSLKDATGNFHPTVIHFDQPIYISITGQLHKEEPALNIGYALYNEEGILIYWSWIQNSFIITDQYEVQEEFELSTVIPAQYLTAGTYRIEWISVIHQIKSLKSRGEGPFINFEIEGGDRDVMVNPQFKWQSK